MLVVFEDFEERLGGDDDEDEDDEEDAPPGAGALAAVEAGAFDDGFSRFLFILLPSLFIVVTASVRNYGVREVANDGNLVVIR